ncbi:MAG: sulfite exporter TauE/SafE family protein [Candidatus Nezhaarchaeota archaeon]|nr:sulfite exporter TauE/SafE family protein [Candidatus Nezhaarchaeota archaeon]MCX8141651.1 sulfite exporter TauE/SafE family protein [Candidatus Nezhaarchaeota archaeon]MDW8049918.1 sulfite exporter TauE/SafE family protein [Nitrososphaerota archaeon]
MRSVVEERFTTIPWVMVLISISFTAGLIGSILGIGGGIILIPVLSSFLGVTIKEAAGASLVCIIATGVVSTRRYLSQRLVNTRLALFLETTAVIGAFTGAHLAALAPSSALHIIFSVLLASLAALQLKGARREDDLARLMPPLRAARGDHLAKIFKLSSKYYDAHLKVDVEYNVTNSRLGLMSSLFAGMLSSALGIGGGILKVPIMNRLMGVPIKVSIATSQLMITITGSIGVIAYLSLGLLDTSLVAPMVIGTALGSTLGAMIMNRIKASKIGIAFGILLAYLSYVMLGRGLALAFNVYLPGA